MLVKRCVAALVVAVMGAAVLEMVPAPEAVAAPRTAGKAGAAQAELSAADVASAQVTARVRNRRVEVLGLRDERTTTWVNPDGSFTTEQATGLVRVRDAKAKDGWADVDVSLAKATDGSLFSRVHPAGLVLAGKTGSAGTAALAALSDRTGHQVALGWAGELPEPVIDGTRATYSEVQPGVDLVVEATRAGFEQFLVLTSRPAGPVSFELPLTLKGISARTRADGNTELLDAKGQVRGRIPAGQAWDASRDPASGESRNRVPLGFSIRPRHLSGAAAKAAEAAAKAGVSLGSVAAVAGADLVLTPDKAWLADPATKFPVTLDPSVALSPTFDTYVQSNVSSTDLSTQTELRAGTYDGTTKARSYLTFSMPYKGATVSAATLKLWNTYSYSCTARAVEIRTSPAADTSSRWSNQPVAYSGSAVTSVNAAKGYSSSCAAAWLSFNVQAQAQWWATNGASTQGYQVKAASETDTLGWKKFASANASGGMPVLSVTYNRPPYVPGAATHTPGVSSATATTGWTNTVTPSVRAVVSDPDGGTVKALFTITNAATGAVVVSDLAGSIVTSGGTSVAAVPANLLSNGTAYLVKARASDGVLSSGLSSAYDRVTVDTTGPGAPGLSSSMFPSGQWSDPAYGTDNAAHFSATAAAGDASGVQWSLDAQTFTSAVTVAGTTPKDITVPKSLVTDGQHTLFVRNTDPAGNAGALASFTFYAGPGVSLSAPAAGQVTARRLLLGVSTDPALSLGGVTAFQYRRGGADSWHSIPLADVMDSSGTAVTAWPGLVLSGAVNTLNTPGSFLTWDAAKTLGVDNANPGGVLQVRALFANATSTTPASTLVDVNGGGAGSADLGPGSVNLATGQFSLSDADADFFGASIGRTYGSRSLTAGTDDAQAGGFGPQWAASGLADATDSEYTAVRKTSATSADLVLAGGDTIAFVLKPGSSTAWVGEPGAQDLVLTGSLTSATFTLTDLDGNVTTFTDQTPSGRTFWPITASTPTGSGNTARYSYTLDAAGKLRLYRVIAANPSLSPAQLAACGTDTVPARGCRVLELTWSNVPLSAGGTVARITSIASKAWDPDLATPTMTTVVLATYDYEGHGWLASVTDPRPGALGAGFHALSTTYGYDSDGRVTSLTPPGELGYTFTYAVAGPAWDQNIPDTAGHNTSAGRLVKVSRATLTPGTAATVNGTAQQSVVYGVPLSTTRGPLDLSAPQIQAWGQTSVPADATAVFDADAAQTDFWAGDDGTKRDWSRAEVTYLDANGNEVNHLARGGSLDVTNYDQVGQETSSLTGANRALALAPDTDDRLVNLGLSGMPTTAKAERLSAKTGYETGTVDTTAGFTGAQRVAWTQGPLHTVQLGDGTLIQARATTRTSYDSNRPAGSPVADLPTSTSTGGLDADADPATAALLEPRTSTTSYDWATGLPLSTTGDPTAAAGDEITTTTGYDAAGRVTAQVMPKGGAAGTRNTVYWDGQASGPCTAASHPEWGGLVCSVGAAGPISAGVNPQLVATAMTYTRDGGARVVTETANSTTRVTTTTYDAAGRPVTIAVTNPGGGLGAAVPDKTLTYDPDTGAQISIAATIGGSVRTVSTTQDVLGRDRTYTDATGLSATTSYDALDDVTSVTQSDGSTTATITNAYDATTRRLSSQTDSQAGAITLSYDTDGTPLGQTFTAAGAQGLKMSQDVDPTGALTGRTWQMNDPANPGQLIGVLAEDVVENVQGQWVDQSMLPGGHRTYSYDGTGRLTGTTELQSGTCTNRGYAFDKNGNRTGENTATTPASADANGNLTLCPAPSTPAVTHTYDSGDRITDTGYQYDPFGRTTRLPQPGGHVETIGYAITDLAATLTTYASAADADTATSPLSSQTLTLDPTGTRFQNLTTTTTSTDPDTGQPVTTTTPARYRYANGSDAPAWIQENTTTGDLTRNITGPLGDLVATSRTPGGATSSTVTYQITSLHGDIAATLADTDTSSIDLVRPDEYGNTGLDTNPRYGWLGAKQRPADTPGDLTLMGVRLYNPTTGRFLQTDPIYGGNDNTYNYPNDPINTFDLDGNSWWRRGGRWLGRHASTIGTIAGIGAMVATGPVGWTLAAVAMGASGYSAYRNFRRRQYRAAAWDALGVAVGVGSAVRAARASRLLKRRRMAKLIHYGYRGAGQARRAIYVAHARARNAARRWERADRGLAAASGVHWTYSHRGRIGHCMNPANYSC